jgi:hypothetical protein
MILRFAAEQQCYSADHLINPYVANAADHLASDLSDLVSGQHLFIHGGGLA